MDVAPSPLQLWSLSFVLGDVHRVLLDGGGPGVWLHKADFSPDGGTLAYVRDTHPPERRSEIMVVGYDATGPLGEPRASVTTTESYISQIQWRP